MNMHVHDRRSNGDVTGRSKMARIAVALLATAALCLGPAVAASADDATNPADTSVTSNSTLQTPDTGGDAATAGAEGQAGSDDIADGDSSAEDSSGGLGLQSQTLGAEQENQAGVSTEESDEGSEAGDEGTENEGTEDTGSDTTAPTDGVGATGVLAGLSIEGNTGGEHSKTGNCQETEKSMWDHECNEPPECPVDVAQVSTFGDHEGGDHCQEPPECQPSVATLSDREGGDHCQEPPECPVDVAKVSTFGDHEGGDHCQEPPECQPAVASYGDHETAPECPKPPVCETPRGPQNELLSSNEGPNWNQDGRKWECPKNPEIKVIPGDCINVVGDGEGEGGYEVMSHESVAQIIGSNLKPGRDYKVVVWFDGYEVFSDTLEADGDGDGNGMITAWPSLTEVGSYVATITSLGHKPRSASAEFNVRACPPVVVPELTVTVLPCPSNDSTLPLQAKLQATGLEPGESYAVSVTGPSGFVWNGSLMGTDEGTAETIVSLGANGAYTATLEGSRAGIEFTATKTCAPKVITPPAAAGPALPNTGSADTQPLLWAGLLAMLVAVGLMLQPVRTRRMKR